MKVERQKKLRFDIKINCWCCIKKVGNVISLTDFANCDVLQHIENESGLPKSCTANSIINHIAEFTSYIKMS